MKKCRRCGGTEFYNSGQCKECKKDYERARRKTPEVIACERARSKTQKRKAYNKAYRKAYIKTQKGKSRKMTWEFINKVNRSIQRRTLAQIKRQDQLIAEGKFEAPAYSDMSIFI